MLTALTTQLFRADLVDPSPDGIFTRVINFTIVSLMLLVVPFGAWQGVSVWMEKKGASVFQSLRTVVLGVILVEAFLGGVLVLANLGSGLLPSLGLG